MLVKGTELVDTAIVYKRDLYNFSSFISFIVMSSVGSIGINVVAVEYNYELSFKSIQRCRGIPKRPTNGRTDVTSSLRFDVTNSAQRKYEKII